MKYLFSRSLILCASTLVSLFIATQSAWGADAVLFNVDFTKMSAENISGTSTDLSFVERTYNTYSMYFGTSNNSSSKMILSTSGLTFDGNNYNSKCCLAIPLTLTANNEVTVTVTLASSGKIEYGWATGDLPATPSAPKGTTYATNAEINTITYTPTSAGSYVLYLGRSSSSSGKVVKSIKITQVSATPSTTYCISVFNSTNEGKTNFSESATNAGEYVIENFVVPAANGNGPQCWVGENSAWSNSYSDNWYLSDIPLTAENKNKLGSAAGAIGTLHIWPASSKKNKDLQFSPDSYGMSWGTGGSWSFVPFSQVEGYKWQTDLVTISTTARDSWQYWVGFSASPSGYVFSTTKSKTIILSAIRIVTSDGSISETTVSSLTADTKGKFEIYDNSTDLNWYVHFIPYYHVAYDEAGGSEVADGEYFAVDAGEQSITLPAAPTKAGYRFVGWKVGNTTYQPEESYTFTPTADVTLTAQWEPTCMDIAAATMNTPPSNMTASIGGVNVQGAAESDNYLKLKGDNWTSHYIQLTAANGSAPFAAGDVLYVTCYNKGNSPANRGFKIGTTTNVTCTLNIAATSEGVVTYTLTSEDIETDGTIKLTRTDADDRYKSVRVERCSSTPAPVVEKKAPHRNYQIAERDLRPYTSTTHYPLFDVTPKATAEYTGDKWKSSYTIHHAGTVTAGKATIDWVREDATGSTISLGANYEQLSTWLSTNGFGEKNVGDTIMLTVRTINSCNEWDDATADSIPIILTNKYSLAYIVTGNTTTRKFYDITASDIADPLYTQLRTKYNVTPVSAYATYDYTNYEPYDLLLLTDYPKATGTNAQPDYVNALADLVDKKPILSLKAHMSALSNWIAKGFTSNPVVPGDGTEGQAQKTLTVLCFSHDMFAGAEWDNPDDPDDRTLTILSDVYQDGSTYKGIQGFAAINSSNFVNIATVYDAKGNRNLVACCERQDVTAARFIMLSINQGATKYINIAGQDAIDKLLKYLLWTEATNVSDCSLIFNNAGDDHLWSNHANWDSGKRPTQLQNVRIEANCIVSGNTYGAGNVRIKKGYTLTIAPDGGLASVGKFGVYSGENWNQPQPITDTKYIIVEANEYNTGMLMHSHTDQLAATVQMYSPAYYEGGKVTDGHERIWSYVAIPVQEGTVPQIFNGAYTYLWSEKDGWIRYKDGSTFRAFNGIALSQPSPQTFTFAGNLALAQKYEFTLTNTKNSTMQGMNLIGNSWTAPIQISKLKTSDFGEGLIPTVYIYSTGRDPEGGPATTTEDTPEAGYWTAIPVLTAKTEGWKGPKVIPAMQAFEVNFDPEASVTSATLTLDYDTIVRASGVDYSTLNQKLYAPGRNSTAEILQPDPSAPAPYEPTMLRIRVADTAACYNLHLLQGERFSEGFDNGWDGFYTGTDGRAPGLCALTTAGEMQVSAQPEIDNTTLVFTPGKSDTYTFSFCLTETEEEPLAQPLYLNDMQLRKSCPIDDNVTYTFRYSENDMENRFFISHIAFEEQDTPTGIANLATVDQQLMLNNPAREALTIRVYDPAGRLCSEMSTREAMLQITLPEPQGVYMIHITGEQTEILQKIVQ